ncbi:trypsin eta-like isoform X3 [Drosophila willistoni]|uniref:trypsin eta-like isoform X3 n=1 Tax=Drosophila willistoni TaxID=7260 RepID=UPI001F074E5C|nr:trypsin eta-like isoform X3 [Drosophila willistoni]
MYLSKFFVSFILLLQLSINSIAVQWNNENNDFKNKTELSLVELKPFKSTSLTSYKTLDRRQGKRNATEDDDFEFLISGGYRPESNPLSKFLVSIRTTKEQMSFGDNHYCGGSIISRKAILTVAHCIVFPSGKVRNPESILIVAGTPRRLLRTENTQVMAVDEVIPHPDFSQINNILKNDVGIMKLKHKLKLDEEFVDIVPLADTEPKTGPMPDEVLNGDVNILAEWECKYQGISKGGICAGNRDSETDSREGDSGGPMICNNKQVGIVSGGGESKSYDPSIYSDVYYYRKWIAQNGANYISRSIYKLMLLLLAIIKLAINT